jgi:enoyl-CoA hydratase/carnithine racemase
MTEYIRSFVRDEVGHIEIVRPEKRNAITLQMWDDMARVLDNMLARPLRAIVIAGASGHFAAGADISEFDTTKATPQQSRRSFLAVDHVCRLLYDCSVPVVAAIDGYAIGAGLELALACDIRLAADSSRLGITAAKLGITIGRGHIRRLIAVVGAARAIDLLTSARLVSAVEAYQMGLVTEVVPSAQLADRVEVWTERYRRRAPLSMAWAKEVVHRVLADPNLSSDPDDVEESIRCFETDDFREAVRAFRERRTPNFHGH